MSDSDHNPGPVPTVVVFHSRIDDVTVLGTKSLDTADPSSQEGRDRVETKTRGIPVSRGEKTFGMGEKEDLFGSGPEIPSLTPNPVVSVEDDSVVVET